MAVKKNGSYIGILLFPEIPKVKQRISYLNKIAEITAGSLTTSSFFISPFITVYFFNNQILGIEMGVNIFNLSETINIQFSNVNMVRDAKHFQNNLLLDTIRVQISVICQCSHLTFFALIMVSHFYLAVAYPYSSWVVLLTQTNLLHRKNKASEAVKILMNLFVALFLLNLCFLINESIAKLKVLAACVVMAAALHYSMLATFTWFFMQALHLYFNLHQISTDIKYYICKICIAGWGEIIPALIVIGLLASSNYGNVEISDNNGTSVNMCWIPDSTLHLGVNIGYYGIVFIFTLTVFLVTVVQITKFASKADNRDKISTKKTFFSLLGLFCLLGISWGFAFFSYGPLLLPSYYIFTILNSFQGKPRTESEPLQFQTKCLKRKNNQYIISRATENMYITFPYA
uniref:G-protein coupled receptors family 2 profile 2 domain-containing protein n=1 Tax=Xiphophorus couchianus TaxID=32473 RepID=A0A3B5LUG3_9TELE